MVIISALCLLFVFIIIIIIGWQVSLNGRILQFPMHTSYMHSLSVTLSNGSVIHLVPINFSYYFCVKRVPAAVFPLKHSTGFSGDVCCVYSADEIPILHLSGYELTCDYLEQTGFTVPIIVDNPDGLDLHLPPSDFTVRDVENYVGQSDVFFDQVMSGNNSNNTGIHPTNTCARTTSHCTGTRPNTFCSTSEVLSLPVCTLRGVQCELLVTQLLTMSEHASAVCVSCLSVTLLEIREQAGLEVIVTVEGWLKYCDRYIYLCPIMF